MVPHDQSPGDVAGSPEPAQGSTNELRELRAERDVLRSQLAELQRVHAKAQRKLDRRRQRRRRRKQSVLWRVLRPFRLLLSALGSNRATAQALDRVEAAGRDPALARPQATDAYSRWAAEYDTLTDTDRQAIGARVAELDYRPLISVVMPVYNTDPGHLRAAIDSVRRQLYPNWEICIADDASTEGTVRETLAAYATDKRVKVLYRSTNGHIAAASNDALTLAEGEFVALLDHDDILAEHALYEVVRALNRDRDLDLLYSDEDRIDEQGWRDQAYFKPDWDPDLLLVHNLISHLGVYRRSILQKIGGFRPGFDGSQDYDLALRFSTQTVAAHIHHIPMVLYHWRKHADHASFSASSLERCTQAARRAIDEHLGPDTVQIEPLPSSPSWHRVIFPCPEPAPLVSVVIPTRNRGDLLAGCIDGLRMRTGYPSIEILIIDNDSDEESTLELLDRLAEAPDTRVVRFPGEFNYAAMNNEGALAANGELLLLLNNDVEPIAPGWLRELVAYAVRPDVGAVGPKLLYPDDTIQHAGVVLGVGGIANHYGYRRPRSDPGYFSLLASPRSVAAVTGACLLVRRETYQSVGGLDQQHLKVAYNDVDFCLRLRERGLRNVYTPFAELYHLESATRGTDLDPDRRARLAAEEAVMRSRWWAAYPIDPYYNPHFSRSNGNFQLALAARQKP